MDGQRLFGASKTRPSIMVEYSIRFKKF